MRAQVRMSANDVDVKITQSIHSAWAVHITEGAEGLPDPRLGCLLSGSTVELRKVHAAIGKAIEHAEQVDGISPDLFEGAV